MELKHDWVGLERVFIRPRRAGDGTGATARGDESASASVAPIYFVSRGDRGAQLIIEAFAENEDLSPWIGRDVAEAKSQLKNRDVHVYDAALLDDWIDASLEQPHFLDQIELWQAKSGAHGRDHFLIEGLRSWWTKLLPAAYGLFVRIDGIRRQEFLVLFRKGKLEAFFRPDLSYLAGGRGSSAASVDRRDSLPDVAKYLSEKYGMPVQVLRATDREWATWNQSTNPWRALFRSVRQDPSRLSPPRAWLQMLAAIRAYLGF